MPTTIPFEYIRYTNGDRWSDQSESHKVPPTLSLLKIAGQGRDGEYARRSSLAESDKCERASEGQKRKKGRWVGKCSTD